MAYQYPKSLQNLINELSALPGLGSKAAQRLAFHLLNRDREDTVALARAIVDARTNVHPCPRCGNYTDEKLCAICSDPTREQKVLCVVEGVADLISIERSGRFRGLYHVLGGVISPLDGMGPEQLHIAELEQRVAEHAVQEMIVATNPTAEGEATALYLAKRFKPKGVRVSRLAHGMPVGGSLAFTDEATLDLAIRGRKEL